MRRRTYLHLVGVSTVTYSAAAAHAEAADASPYGEGGYGESGYGGGSDGDGDDGSDDTDEIADPVIESLVLDDTSGPNPHVDLEVIWSVAHPDGALNEVRIVVRNESDRVIDGTTVAVDGGSASGTDLFTIKHGAGETYAVTLRVSDTAGNTASTSATISTSR